MLHDRIKKEYDSLTNRIRSIQKELETLPPGKLICCQQKNTSKWYLSDGHHKIYLKKANRPLAEQLARKKYLSLLLQDLKQEQTALAFYLRHHSSPKSEHLLMSPSGFQPLLLPHFQPLSHELNLWMNSPYDKNPNYHENLIYKGITNNFLRSKSEVMIDMMLRTHHIPFRYECALQLGNSLLYPDFTIRHPQTGAYYYWEHFGLMDVPSYIENTTSKLNLYASHGITPGIQLITTYETKNQPLDPELVEKYIEYHFL
nr:ATPase [Lachnospiraceae bacterium]